MCFRMSVRLIAIALVSIELCQTASAQAVQRPPAAAQQKKEPAPVPVPIEDGNVALTPKNTTVQFVGEHTGPDPRPRTGYFTKFAGTLAIDEGTKALRGATLEIEISSLITP